MPFPLPVLNERIYKYLSLFLEILVMNTDKVIAVNDEKRNGRILLTYYKPRK